MAKTAFDLVKFGTFLSEIFENYAFCKTHNVQYNQNAIKDSQKLFLFIYLSTPLLSSCIEVSQIDNLDSRNYIYTFSLNYVKDYYYLL